MTTTRWLQEHHPGATLFVVGEQPLKRALTEAGFQLSEDPEQIDVVVASYDRTFDYAKLQTAFDAIWFHRRAILVQTNPDRFCPSRAGVESLTAPRSPQRSRPAPGSRRKRTWASPPPSCWKKPSVAWRSILLTA